MIFNPNKKRDAYNKFMLEYLLKGEINPGDPIGNFAINYLGDALCGWFVGLDADVRPVVIRSLGWLEQAIALDESFGINQNLHREALHCAKALGLWMRDSINDAETWNLARQYSKVALEEGDAWPQQHISTYGLDDYMAYCFQAEKYDVGIEEFEKCCGAKLISFKKTLKPRELAYALCLNRTRQQFDELDLLKAGRRMLQSNLEETWLGSGQYIRAAIWLKIVHWNTDSSLTPMQIILKAYEDMPHVSSPGFMISTHRT